MQSMHGFTDEQLRGKRITVAGLGHFGGGVAVTRWLVSRGARVLVTDKEPAEKLAESIAQISDLPIELRLGEHRSEDFTSCDLLVISPAIKPSNPYLLAAQNAGAPITTEIAFFIERCPARIVGVTGTKGKSTTSTLLGRMLQTKYKTWVGGNIGKSLLSALPDIDESDLVLLELSSYMLHYLEPLLWSPHVAVITMLAEDHLDWHGSATEYWRAKQNIVRFQTPRDIAVIGPDAESFAKKLQGRVIRYDATSTPPFDLALPGAHNQLNAQAAFAAASALGVSRAEAAAAVKDFTGLPHRMERVTELNGVTFYNDSIATVPAAAIAALHSFPRWHVIQIVGGSDKGLSFDSMCNELAQHAKAVLCIGSVGPRLSEMLRARVDGDVPLIHDCSTLERAISLAKQIAAPADVVLLSTGCASYDQFSNFEQRGDLFRKWVIQPT